ncbi:MAG TPA: hypothetical protein VFG62_21460 [Rhodopila sp.]|nr:hypothetical protein [Rhodopila sp.]
MQKRALAVLALTALLFGCGPARNEFAPTCPAPRLVSTLADLTRFSPTAKVHDITGLILQARVVAINGTCQAGDDKSTIAAKAKIGVSVRRGPAMPGRAADLPVFLAVTLGDQVLDKHVYQVHVMFPPNVDRVDLVSPEIDLVVPVSGNVTGASYGLIAGFQLTPDELAANQSAQATK